MFTKPGHEHDAFGEEGAVARDSGRHDSDTVLGVVVLHRNLVEEVQAADVHRLDLAQAEVEEDRLLRPLVDHPLALALLGDPCLAAVEEGDRLLDCITVELAALPQLVDALGQLHHASSSPIPPRNRQRVS